MADETKEKEFVDVHVQMWKHYDNLRQQKNNTFLTANSILAAIAAFSTQNMLPLGWAYSLVGITIGVAWFLLLTRNSAYIEYHRNRVGPKWIPESRTPSSGILDRTLPVAFSIFWGIFLIFSII